MSGSRIPGSPGSAGSFKKDCGCRLLYAVDLILTGRTVEDVGQAIVFYAAFDGEQSARFQRASKLDARLTPTSIGGLSVLMLTALLVPSYR